MKGLQVVKAVLVLMIPNSVRQTASQDRCSCATSSIYGAESK